MSPSSQSRNIRVFLSSCFQDMQSERNYLVEHTFQTFRHIAAQRHVDFSVVDLRWGVTEEEAQQGKVIEICLNEINNTRPFFIGLIGSRYGWCPTHEDIIKNQRLLNLYPCVQQYVEQGLSMTEIEMQYGVLNAADKVYANFFIKNAYKTDNTSDENSKLDNLRRTITQKAKEGLCEMQYYDDSKHLGEKVLKSLIALLDELYPVESADEISMLVERQRFLLHQMQAVYENESAQEIMSQTIFQMVFKMYAERHCVAVTTKDNTVGKTAFAANWGVSKDTPYIIRTILNEKDNTAEIALQHFHAEMQLRGLHPSDQITWTIDGLDYLNSQTERALTWLLNEELHDVQLVLTANDPVILRNIESLCIKDERAGFTIYVGAILEEDAKKLTFSYLKLFAKGLTEEQVDRIVQNKLFLQNALFLKLFLHELIQFGVYEKLDQFMSPYLEAATESQLIEIILRRLENEYGENVISTYFGFLSLAEKGIPEMDLQRLTGLNNILWAALRSATNLFVDTFQNLISLNRYLRKYVRERYNSDPEIVHKKRLTLKKIYIYLINELIDSKQGKNSTLALFCTEYVRVQLAEENPQKVFTRDSWAIWRYAISNTTIAIAFINFINGSAQLLNNCMSDEMICEFTASDLLNFVRSILNNNVDEIIDFGMSVSNRNLPDAVKEEWNHVLLVYLEKIQKKMEAKTNTFEEEAWETTPLNEFSLSDLIAFETRLITITDLTTIQSVKKKVEKLTRRFIENDEKREFAPIVAELFTLMSYCCLREKDYDSMCSFHALAAHTDPVGFDALSMTTFQINLAQNLNSECEFIIQQIQQDMDNIDTSDTKKHLLGTLYTMRLLYLAHNKQTDKALDIVNNILNLWYPEDIEETFTITYWAATIMEINEFYSYAGIMYKKAQEIALSSNTENECRERSVRCLKLAGIELSPS